MYHVTQDLFVPGDRSYAYCYGTDTVGTTTTYDYQYCGVARFSRSAPKDNGCNGGANGGADVGNPVHAGRGNKWAAWVDVNAPKFGNFSPTYNSSSDDVSFNLGIGWSHSYGRSIAQDPDSIVAAIARRADGKIYEFFPASGLWTPDADIPDRLTELKNTNGVRTGWKYYEASTENTELYDATGRLQSITTRAGVVQTLTYETSPPPGQEPRLLTVTDSFGRSLSFTYYPATATTGANNLATVADHAGNTVSYTYDASNNLATVTYPGGQSKTYLYNEPAYTQGANLPNALTGIVDEHGTRFATYQYDAQGRAISTEHAGGVEKYQLNYVSPYSQTVVTDPLGTQRTYNFQTILGVVKTTGVDQPCPSCGGTQSQATTYDANGNADSRTDFNGKKTCYAYDLSRNLETARVEGLTAADDCATALGMTQAQLASTFARSDVRKVSTTWHASYRLPATVTEPAAGTTVGGAPGSKSTVFTYDASGNLTQKDVTAPRNDGSGTNETRTWKWTYNPLGQVLTATDPLNNVITTVYYAATDTAVPPKYTKGDVQTVTNAASHVTTFNEYDKNGRLTKLTDPNGLVTTMSYHPRGWLTARSVNNGASVETTSYTYDKVGQLTRVTLPDGSTLHYAYDDAHRLVGMSDQVTGITVAGDGSLRVQLANLAGNKIIYTLDNMGNRTAEANYDPSGTVKRSKSRVIDALNRLQQDIGGTTYAVAPTQAITQYGYDNNGNLTTTTDPLGRVTTNSYDALNRLVSVIDPYNGATKPTLYSYNAAGQLETVTDPQGLTTSYNYSGHADLVKQTSPDTGATQFKYNAAGNVVAKIDSANRCAITSYDSLNRVSTVKYYAASNTGTNTAAKCFGTIAGTVAVEETVSYSYDSTTATLGGAGGKGRLGQITDATGNTAYVYDKNGRVLNKTHTTTGATNAAQAVAYTYSANGQLQSVTYPSGNTVAYTYGAASSNAPGKVIGLMLNPTGYTASGNGGTTPTGGVALLTGSVYEPFGPNGGWTWGNSCTGPASTCNLTSTPRLNQHLRVFDRDHRPVAIQSDPEGYNRNIAWDQANRITGITVPGTSTGSPTITLPGISNALSVNQAYQYDALDRLTNLAAGKAGATTLATGMALLPNEGFTYDAIGNRLTRATTPPGSTTQSTATYSYPNLATTTGTKRHTLTGITGSLTDAFTYDATGNTLTESAALATMNPSTGAMNGASTNLINTFDGKNRLSKVQVGGTTTNTVTYKINALGQRIQKVGAGTYLYSTSTTLNTTTGLTPQGVSLNFNARFAYDEQGRLIGEYAPDGKLVSEIIYFNDLPIATLRPKGASVQNPLGLTGTTTGNPSNGATAANANNVGNNTATNRVNVEVFYVHADHLGTPRAITRSTIATGTNAPSSATATSPGAINKAVWRWESDPFGTSIGSSAPNENPQVVTGTASLIQGATFRHSQAFPGQTRDLESGKAYNYFRDYDPAIGRYVESDPIGLKGGVSTFGYVGQRPSVGIDPRGLAMCWYTIGGSLTCSPENGGPILSIGPPAVFSGEGECKNNPKCIEKKSSGPIPPGCYRVVPHESKIGFWRLIPIGWVPGFSRWRCSRGYTRCDFELHPGSLSLGCVTIDSSNEAAIDTYSGINGMLLKDAPDNFLCVGQ